MIFENIGKIYWIILENLCKSDWMVLENIGKSYWMLLEKSCNIGCQYKCGQILKELSRFMLLQVRLAAPFLIPDEK